MKTKNFQGQTNLLMIKTVIKKGFNSLESVDLKPFIRKLLRNSLIHYN